MYCILCEKEVNHAISALIKDGAFIILGSINPEEYSAYQRQAIKLQQDGWKNADICIDYHRKI